MSVSISIDHPPSYKLHEEDDETRLSNITTTTNNIQPTTISTTTTITHTTSVTSTHTISPVPIPIAVPSVGIDINNKSLSENVTTPLIEPPTHRITYSSDHDLPKTISNHEKENDKKIENDTTSTSTSTELNTLELMDYGRCGKHIHCFGHTIPCTTRTWIAQVIIAGFIIAAIVIGFSVYRSLHSDESNNIHDRLHHLCRERAATLRSTMGQSISSMQGAAGFGRLSIRSLTEGPVVAPVSTFPINGAPLNNTIFEDRVYANATKVKAAVKMTDFVDFLQYSAAARFIEQIVWMPLIRNSSRAKWTNNTGIVIKDAPIRKGFTERTWDYDIYWPWHFFILNRGESPDFIGLDMSILHTILYDMEQSINSGKIWLSNRTDATNKNEYGEPQYGLYVVLPVFHQQVRSSEVADVIKLLDGLVISRVNTSIDRWNDTIGVVFASIRMSSVMNATLQALQLYPLQLDLYDLDPPQPDFSFITTGNPLRNISVADAYISRVRLTFGNHRYELVCTPTLSFVESSFSSTPLIIGVGAGGIVLVNLILLLLMGFLWGWHREQQRSQQLQEANKAKAQALVTLQHARMVSERANKSKTDFLSFLCHELRNPLHAIGAMLDFLHESDTLAHVADREDLDCLATIDAQVKVMNVIVNDALDLSKIEAGKMAFETIGFSMARVLKAVVAGFTPRATAQGITLRLSLSEDLHPWVYGDPTRIRQVIINLVSNAIKFTNVGGVHIHARSWVVEKDENKLQQEPHQGSQVSGASTSASASASASIIAPRLHMDPDAELTSSVVPTAVPMITAKSVAPLATNSTSTALLTSTSASNLPLASTGSSRSHSHSGGASNSEESSTGIRKGQRNRSRRRIRDAKNQINPMRQSEIAGFEIVVEDTGCGIGEEILPLLFQPFTQATLSVARKFGGTGLGLSIVRQIVELMGGTISVSSTKYVGTAITIRFTLATTRRGKNKSERTSTGTDTDTGTDTNTDTDSRGTTSRSRQLAGDSDTEAQLVKNDPNMQSHINAHTFTQPPPSRPTTATTRKTPTFVKPPSISNSHSHSHSHSRHSQSLAIEQERSTSERMIERTPYHRTRRMIPMKHQHDESSPDAEVETETDADISPYESDPDEEHSLRINQPISEMDQLMAQLRTAQEQMENNKCWDTQDGQLSSPERQSMNETQQSAAIATGTGQRVLFGLSSLVDPEAPPHTLSQSQSQSHSTQPTITQTIQSELQQPQSQGQTAADLQLTPTLMVSANSVSGATASLTRVRIPSDPNTGPTPTPTRGSIIRSNDNSSESISLKKTKSIHSGFGYNVLVVDDSPINLKILVRLLNEQGCTCTTALDGKQALDLLTSDEGKQTHYHVIFTDIVMPVMDGVSLARAYRLLERCNSISSDCVPIPIVAVTANAMEHDRQECFDAGMTHFISKPFRKQQLHHVLNQIHKQRTHNKHKHKHGKKISTQTEITTTSTTSLPPETETSITVTSSPPSYASPTTPQR